MGLFDKYKKSNLNESKDWSAAMENNNSNIDRLARLRTQVNIDPVMEEVIDSNEKSDKNAKEVFTKLAKDAEDITPKDPGTGKKVTIKPYTEKLTLDEGLFKESIVNEDYNIREYSDQLYDMIEDDTIDVKKVAEDLIYWCSEDDVKEYMRVNDLILDDEEYDESFSRRNGRLRESENGKKKYIVTNIDYAIEEEDVEDYLDNDDWNEDELEKEIQKKIEEIRKSLPKKLIIKVYDEDDIADEISDRTGWLVNDFDYKEIKDESFKSLKEAKSKQPKYWNSMFTTKVIDAYKDGKLTLDNIDEWEKEYNGGTKPTSLGTKEILTYHMNTGKDPRNESLEKKSLEDLNLLEYVNEEDEEDDEYTVYDLLNDRLFGYGINKSNFRVKWKFAEIEPTVKTRDGKLKRGYFYPTIHQDELVTGKGDDRRAFTEDGIGVFVHDEDEASLAKKCAEELNLDFVMKKLVRPYNGFNYIATIKVSDDIQEMPIKDYMESIGKSMSDLLRGKGDKIKSNFKDSKNYKSRKANKEQQENTEE